MILSVELKDFMGSNRIVTTKTSTVLSGRNGSGKTTILHALAFALCGTDAWGTPAPVFMISNEKDKMEVIVKTDKTTIQRSLTRNKTANLKIMLEGVWVNMNQTQMASLVGPPTHVLAVLNPKYFFSLPHPKQVQLLSSLIPEEDRVELVQAISGEALSRPDEIKIIQSKPPLRAAELFALKRREAENSQRYRDSWLQNLDDRRKEVEAAMKDGYADPAEEQEYETLKKREALYRHACDTYRLRKDAADEKRDARDAGMKDHAQKIDTLAEDLRELQSRVVVAERERDAARGENQKAYEASDEARVRCVEHVTKNSPKIPHVTDLPSSDHCPRCGQAVSKRYRDSIEAENESIIKEYRRRNQKFENEKEELDAAFEHLRKEQERACASLKAKEMHMSELRHATEKIRNTISFHERELENLKRQVISEPMVPEKDYSPDRLKELEEKLAGLKPSRDLTALCDKLNEYELDKSKVIRDHHGVDKAAAHFLKLEMACKRIPEREMERTKVLFNFSGYSIDTEVKDLVVGAGGTPYSIMSAGQRMCAEISLSLHINSLLEKKVNLVFADDFELVDAGSAESIRERLQAYDVQVIRSKVTNKDFSSEAV